MKPGFPGLFCKPIFGKLQTVSGTLHVGESHFIRFCQNPEPVGVHCGFTAGKLHDTSSNRSRIAKRLQNLDDLLKRRFIDIILNVCIGKTDRAGKVAAVGQIHVCQNSVADMQVAHTAIIRTRLGIGNSRVGDSAPNIAVPGHHAVVIIGVR
jgi:hypothetical protein